MIHEMVMPQLAMGMSEGTIVEWLAGEGARVERDAPLVSIETEKVVTDLPAPYAGFVHIIAEVQATIEIEQPIAHIAETEEEYRQVLNAADGGAAGAPAVAAVAAQPPAPTVAASPAGAAAVSRIKASGLARKIAANEGVSLAELTGTGPAGRIVRRDVMVAIEARATRAQDVSPSPVVPGRRVKERIPLTGMRGAIAKRMMQAKISAAQTYSFFEIDVTKLLAARATFLDRQEQLGVRVSLVALYTRALALALQRVPICNATLEGDVVTLWDNVDVSMAVAVPGRGEFDSGLLVPVIRNVEAKGVVQISRELSELVARARAGELGAEDTGKHTVTLSSTGGMSSPGAWAVSAPILNLPAVMAFQPGTPKRTPVADADQVVIRDILPCGLTFDHRAMDGAPVGALIRVITDLLSNPELMIA